MTTTKLLDLATALESIKEDTTGEFDDILEDQSEKITEVQESIDYSIDEIGRGLEALVELSVLTTKINQHQSKGISVENYSDIAQIAFDSIKKTIGLENDRTMVDKVKDFIKRLIEGIKNLIKKFKDFFKDFINIKKKIKDKNILLLKHDIVKIEEKIKEKSNSDESAEPATSNESTISKIEEEEIQSPDEHLDEDLIRLAYMFSIVSNGKTNELDPNKFGSQNKEVVDQAVYTFDKISHTYERAANRIFAYISSINQNIYKTEEELQTSLFIDVHNCFSHYFENELYGDEGKIPEDPSLDIDNAEPIYKSQGIYDVAFNRFTKEENINVFSFVIPVPELYGLELDAPVNVLPINKENFLGLNLIKYINYINDKTDYIFKIIERTNLHMQDLLNKLGQQISNFNTSDEDSILKFKMLTQAYNGIKIIMKTYAGVANNITSIMNNYISLLKTLVKKLKIIIHNK